MYNFSFSKIIDEDIDSCYSYIKEKPYSRPLVNDKLLAVLGIRSIKINNYLLFYSIEEDNNIVNVITFMYSKRDWINILKELPLDEII